MRPKNNALAVVAFAICQLMPSGCADPIARADLLQQIQAGTPPQIVDVRSRGEYEASHVPGAIHVPFYTLLGAMQHLDEAASDDSRPVVLYCEHGPRAGIARAQLWLGSDRPVRFLEGHMTAWKQDGLPVEVSPTP